MGRQSIPNGKRKTQADAFSRDPGRFEATRACPVTLDPGHIDAVTRGCLADTTCVTLHAHWAISAIATRAAVPVPAAGSVAGGVHLGDRLRSQRAAPRHPGGDLSMARRDPQGQHRV